MVITAARRAEAKGGCPLGSLGGQLAECDPEARALIATGLDQWAAAISDGVRSLHADGEAPSGIDPDDLATLQGGLLLAQVQRVPVRSKLRSIPSLPLPSADEPKPDSFTAPVRRRRGKGEVLRSLPSQRHNMSLCPSYDLSGARSHPAGKSNCPCLGLGRVIPAGARAK